MDKAEDTCACCFEKDAELKRYASEADNSNHEHDDGGQNKMYAVAFSKCRIKN